MLTRALLLFASLVLAFVFVFVRATRAARSKDDSLSYIAENVHKFVKASEVYEEGIEKYAGEGDSNYLLSSSTLAEQVGYAINKNFSSQGFIVMTPSDMTGPIVIVSQDTNNAGAMQEYITGNGPAADSIVQEIDNVREKLYNKENNERIDIIGGNTAYDAYKTLKQQEQPNQRVLGQFHFSAGKDMNMFDKIMCQISNREWCKQ